jgi:hypothetical protein
LLLIGSIQFQKPARLLPDFGLWGYLRFEVRPARPLQFENGNRLLHTLLAFTNYVLITVSTNHGIYLPSADVKVDAFIQSMDDG